VCDINLTLEEVKQRFGCRESKRCVLCKELQGCTKPEARKYKEYKKNRNKHLTLSYKCEDIGKICTLDKCRKYKNCNKPQKKKYEKWKKAYIKGSKKELESLMKGGK
jgi:hypothetical protein